MKQYEKPNLAIEEFKMEDVVLSSVGFTIGDIHDVGNKDNIFDEVF